MTVSDMLVRRGRGIAVWNVAVWNVAVWNVAVQQEGPPAWG